MRRLLADGVLGQIAQFESHFDRYRPEVRQRWREAGGPGSGLWFDPAPISRISPCSCSASLTGSRPIRPAAPGALSDDYFHVVLGYGERRVILHGSCLVSAVMPRFVVHGSQGSFVKFGMDVQEEQLKQGRPPAADWGVDPVPGQLSQIRDGELVQQTVAGEAGITAPTTARSAPPSRGGGPTLCPPRSAGGDGAAGSCQGEPQPGSATGLSEVV